MEGATVTFNATSEKFEMLDYPGGLGVFGAQAKIEKASEDDTNDYQATFNLAIEYTNETQTDLTWELYMVESEYDGLNAAETTTCKLQQNQVGNQTQFWYADASEGNANAEGANAKSCNAEAITTKLSSTLKGTKIASGTMPHKVGKQTINKDNLVSDYSGTQDSGDLTKRFVNTKDKKSKYYYLVVKYPNKGSEQDADAGKKINVTLKIDGEVASTLYTEGA